MSDREDLTLHANLDDNISAPAQAVKKSLDDVGDKAAKSARQLDLFDHEVKKTGNDAAKAAVQLELFSAAEAKAGDEAAKAARQLRASNDERHRSAKVAQDAANMQRHMAMEAQKTESILNKLHNTTTNLDNAMKKSTGQGGGLFGMMHFGIRFGAIFSFIKFGVIADGITAIGSSIMALGGAALGGISAMAPMVGVLGALPALGMAAMSSMKLLTATMKALKPELAAYGESVTKPGVAILKPQISGLLKSSKPLVTNLMTQTAQGMKSPLQDMNSYAQSSRFQSQFRDISASNKTNVGNLGSSGVSGIKALVDVMHAAIPMTEMLSSKFRAFMQGIASWTSENGSRLSEFFDSAGRIFMNTLHTLSAYSKGVFEIAKLSVGLGSSMGTALQRGGNNFLAWTKSGVGQNKIAKFFEDIKPPLHEFWLLLKAVSTSLFGLSTSGKGMEALANTFSTLRTSLVPVLDKIMNSAQGNMIPKLAETLGSLADIFYNLNMAGVLGGLMRALGIVSAIIAALPGPLKTVLGYLATAAALVKIIGFSLGGWAGYIGLAIKKLVVYIATALAARFLTPGSDGAVPGKFMRSGKAAGGTAAGETAGAEGSLVALPAFTTIAGVSAIAGLAVAVAGLTAVAIYGNRNKAARDYTGAQIATGRTGGLSSLGNTSGAGSGPTDRSTGLSRAFGIADPKSKSGFYAKQDNQLQGAMGGINSSNVGSISSGFVKATASFGKTGEEWKQFTDGLVKTKAALAKVGYQINATTHAIEDAPGPLKTYAGALKTVDRHWGTMAASGKKGAAEAKTHFAGLASYAKMAGIPIAGLAARFPGLTSSLQKSGYTIDAATGKIVKLDQAAKKKRDPIKYQMHLLDHATAEMRRVDQRISALARKRRYLILHGKDETSPEVRKIDAKIAGAKASKKKIGGDIKSALDALNTFTKRVENAAAAKAKIGADDQSARDTVKAFVDYTNAQTATVKVSSTKARWMGGPVEGGTEYTVGELGQEIFRDMSGREQIIGRFGQEQRTFATSGYVIPNHALATRQTTNTSSQVTNSPTVNIGSINAQNPQEIVQTVKMGIIAAEREKNERSMRPNGGR